MKEADQSSALLDSKASNPKDRFAIDDGIDRDAEWTQFEKDEAKRKADRKAKDEEEKAAEQKFRDETKEKHRGQSDRLKLWAPVLFMGPLLPLIGSIIAVSLGFLILMSEHKLNGRPLSIAFWFSSNCNYAFIYVILESTFSAIFLFVVMVILIDPGSTTIPKCATISISRYCCKTAQCIGAWFGIIGSALLILNVTAIPLLWITRQCVFVSAEAVGENQNPYIWGTAAFLVACYFMSWPILIFYACQACNWKKERANKKADLGKFFSMKSKVDLAGYVPLKREMAEDKVKQKEEKAALAVQRKEEKAAAKAEKAAKKAAEKAAKEKAKQDEVTDIAEIPVWPKDKLPGSEAEYSYPQNDGILESEPPAEGQVPVQDDYYYNDQQYAEGDNQQYPADQTW